MFNYIDDDHAFISTLESLPVYLTKIKSGRTQLVNGVKQLHRQLETLKGFKGRTELYSSEIFDYYDPFVEIQETLLASFRASEIIQSTSFSMSIDDARKKSDLSNMIKSPMRFLDNLIHQQHEEQLGDENLEWIAADKIDFEPLSSLLKKGNE